jgi:hypothetical protein
MISIKGILLEKSMSAAVAGNLTQALGILGSVEILKAH